MISGRVAQPASIIDITMGSNRRTRRYCWVCIVQFRIGYRYVSYQLASQTVVRCRCKVWSIL